jgi:hypothetical protein
MIAVILLTRWLSNHVEHPCPALIAGTDTTSWKFSGSPAAAAALLLPPLPDCLCLNAADTPKPAPAAASSSTVITIITAKHTGLRFVDSSLASLLYNCCCLRCCCCHCRCCPSTLLLPL